jgi:branched-chain amino acid transport system substrate-binding protein
MVSKTHAPERYPMTRLPIPRRITVLTLTCSTLLLAACSGKPDANTTSSTVTIGYVGALTGSLAHYGKDEENGVRLAIDDLNAQKLVIAGKTVTFKLQSEDDQADPRSATNAAQRLVDAQVNAVIGHTTSSTTLPAAILYSRAGIPLLAPAVTNPALTSQGYPATYRLIANDIQQGHTLADIAATQLGAKRIAILDDRSSYGVGLANEFEKHLASLGITPIAHESASDKDTDFSAQLTRIKSKTPDLLFFGGNDGQAAALVQQMYNLGLNSKFLAGDGVHTPEFIKLAGPASEGTITTLPGLPLEKMPQGKAFAARFAQKYGAIQLYAPYYYDATQIIAKAMQAAGSTDPKIYAEKLKQTNYAGITSQIQFDAQGDLKTGTITTYQVKAGAWVELPIAGQ